MSRLSRIDLKHIADRVISAYSKLPENSGKAILKIEPEVLIKNLLKLSIEYRHLSLDRSILGLTSYGDISIIVYDNKDNEKIIDVDDHMILIEQDLREKEKMRGRCNFTLMHEACHQILKMMFPRDYGINYRKSLVHYSKAKTEYTPQIIDWDEWQANTLASYILLPDDCIKRSMYMFGFDEKIRLLNRIYSPVAYERFTDMALFLGVSRTSLHIRLKELDLIKDDQFDDPYHFIDFRKVGTENAQI